MTTQPTKAAKEKRDAKNVFKNCEKINKKKKIVPSFPNHTTPQQNFHLCCTNKYVYITCLSLLTNKYTRTDDIVASTNPVIASVARNSNDPSNIEQTPMPPGVILYCTISIAKNTNAVANPILRKR